MSKIINKILHAQQFHQSEFTVFQRAIIHSLPLLPLFNYNLCITSVCADAKIQLTQVPLN